MHYDRIIIGYHGCMASVAEEILAGDGTFRKSQNDYDWLGRGIYFWEYGLDRALRWAETKYSGSPGVVGALVQLGRCFDLMDTRYTGELAQAAEEYVESLRRQQGTIPVNSGRDLAARRFDCALINVYLDGLEDEGERYDTIRCGFVEGGPIYENSQLGVKAGIHRQSHVQVAVRNPKCVIGTFRPELST